MDELVKNEEMPQEAERPKGRILRFAEKVRDEDVCVLATVLAALFIFAPAVMAILAMIHRSIDYTMYFYPNMIKNWIFPRAMDIGIIIYVILILRAKARGERLLEILKRNPLMIIFGLAVYLMIFSQINNGMTYAIEGYSTPTLVETFDFQIGYFVVILFGAAQICKDSHKRFLVRSQILISVLLAIAAFVLWHTQIESDFFADWAPWFSSIFSNINYYGYYLAVSIPIAGAAYIYEKKTSWKIISLGAFALNTVALSIDDSLGAWFGAAFAVVFILITQLIMEKRINWRVLVIIPVFVLCLYIPGHILGSFDATMSTFGQEITIVAEGGDPYENFGGDHRWTVWNETAKIINDNKLFGIGFEGVDYLEYVGPPYNIRPHNEFMQYALFYGIPMAILYFAGCLGIYIRALKMKKSLNMITLICLCGAFGYLVSSFFGLTMFATAPYLFIFLGMGYVRNEYQD